MASSDTPLRQTAAPAAGADRIAVGLWVVALLLVLAPMVVMTDPGNLLIRNTIRLSLAYYAAATALMLTLRSSDWPRSPLADLARWCWTLAWATYVVHVAMAMHYYHGWSHAHAVDHTERVAGVGWGIWISHLFLLIWTLDVVEWWRAPEQHARRPAWVGRALYGFMTFVVFNGTIVYEQGPIRWVAMATFGVLGVLWLRRVARGTSRAV